MEWHEEFNEVLQGDREWHQSPAGAELTGTLRFQWDGGSAVVLIFVVVVAMLSGPSLPSDCRRIEQPLCS